MAAPLLGEHHPFGVGSPLCQAGSRREELLQGVQDLSEPAGHSGAGWGGAGQGGAGLSVRLSQSVKPSPAAQAPAVPPPGTAGEEGREGLSAG